MHRAERSIAFAWLAVNQQVPMICVRYVILKLLSVTSSVAIKKLIKYVCVCVCMYVCSVCIHIRACVCKYIYVFVCKFLIIRALVSGGSGRGDGV